MKKIFFIFILLTIFYFGCKETITDPPAEENFSMDIQVTGENGSPINNVQISVWPKIKSNVSFNKIFNKKNNTGLTTIKFAVNISSFVELTAYDLDNSFIKTIVSSKLNSGIHSAVFSSDKPNKVYKCILNAYTDSTKKSLIFTDYIYSVFLSQNPSQTSAGKTSGEGKLTLVKEILFPSLYNLPEIPYTNEYGPEELGTFTFSDSVTIAVSNEDFTQTVLFTRPVKKGPNTIKLKYSEGIPVNRPVDLPKDPGLNKKFNISLHPDAVDLISFTSRVSDSGVELKWKTGSEVNNKGFEIERHTVDNFTWQKIGFVQGNGSTTSAHDYRFLDKQTNGSGIYYYRLVILDNDGTKTYSPEIQMFVNTAPLWDLYSNYPNPAY